MPARGDLVEWLGRRLPGELMAEPRPVPPGMVSGWLRLTQACGGDSQTRRY